MPKKKPIEIPHFNFSEFFDNVVAWASQGKNISLLNRLLNKLQEQIESWKVSPPTDWTYAYKVIDVLRSKSFPNIESLRSANARLCHIQGLTHQFTFGTEETIPEGARLKEVNFKLALQYFYKSIFYGNIEAWENIGDIYYQQSIKGEVFTEGEEFTKGEVFTTNKHMIDIKKEMRLLSEMPGFAEAMLAYEAGPIGAQKKLLVNCLYPAYWDSVAKGDFQAAKLIVQRISVLSNNEEVQKLLSRREKFDLQDIMTHAETLDNLIQLNQEVSIVASAFVKMVETAKDYAEMNLIFDEATKKIAQSKPLKNPAVDYYISRMWNKMALMLKNEKRTDSREYTIATESETNFLNKVKKGEYPNEVKPFLEFAHGLAKQDGVMESRTANTEEIPTHMSKAARGGCYSALSYVADIIQLELISQASDLESKAKSLNDFAKANDLRAKVKDLLAKSNEVPAMYHLIAAQAGDPRAYFAFVQRIIDRQQEGWVDNYNIDDFTEFFVVGIATLEQAFKNEFVLSKQHEYLQAKIHELNEFFRVKTHRLPELDSSKWTDENKQAYPELHNLVAEYHSLSDEALTERILILHQLILRIDLLQKHKNDTAEFLNVLLTKVNRADSYLSYQRYLKNREILAERTQQQEKHDKENFGSTHGLLPAYWLEVTDPLHRRGALMEAWRQSHKDLSYFAWLKSIEQYKPTRIQQVVYLDEVQRERVRVNFADQQVKYALTEKVLPDGKYLFVMDEAQQFYLAVEHDESNDAHHFHHSSFLAGNPANAAGEMEIKDGKIIRLNNYSGHYAPNIFRLYQCYQFLKEHNMVTSDLRISIVGVNEKQLPEEFQNGTMDLTAEQFERLHEYLVDHPDLVSMQVEQPAPRVSSAQALQETALVGIEKDMYTYLMADATLEQRLAALASAKTGMFGSMKKEVKEEQAVLQQLRANGEPYFPASLQKNNI